MCKEQGPPNYIYLYSIYICNHIYIYKTFLTQNRCWAQPGWGMLRTVMPRPEIGK